MEKVIVKENTRQNKSNCFENIDREYCPFCDTITYQTSKCLVCNRTSQEQLQAINEMDRFLYIN